MPGVFKLSFHFFLLRFLQLASNQLIDHRLVLVHNAGYNWLLGVLSLTRADQFFPVPTPRIVASLVLSDFIEAVVSVDMLLESLKPLAHHVAAVALDFHMGFNLLHFLLPLDGFEPLALFVCFLFHLLLSPLLDFVRELVALFCLLCFVVLLLLFHLPFEFFSAQLLIPFLSWIADILSG